MHHEVAILLFDVWYMGSQAGIGMGSEIQACYCPAEQEPSRIPSQQASFNSGSTTASSAATDAEEHPSSIWKAEEQGPWRSGMDTGSKCRVGRPWGFWDLLLVVGSWEQPWNVPNLSILAKQQPET